MATRRTDIDTDDLVNRYLSGTSEKELADSLGFSRQVVARVLRERGVTRRGQSAAELLKWSRMSEEQRKKQTARAHEASRGRHWTRRERSAASAARRRKLEADFERERELGARTRQARGWSISPLERELDALLRLRGLNPIPQFALGRYNIDLAIAPVAVEVFGGTWHFSGAHAARADERTRYILNRGWNLLVVLAPPITAEVADYVMSYLEMSRSNPTAAREYRMVRGTGEFVSSGGLQDDKITLVPPFTNRRDLATGRYKRVAR